MTHSFDGFDFFQDGYGVTDFGSYTPAPRRQSTALFALRAGGTLLELPPELRTVPYAIEVYGASAADMEAKKDALLAVLTRAKRRLVSGFADSRFIVASAVGDMPIRYGQHGPFMCEVSVEFQSEDAYFSAPAPSTDVRTPTLALFSGTDYRAEFALTPGGTAPAPARVIIANLAGGVTPTAITLRNASTGEYVKLNNAAGSPAGADVAANSVLVIDPLAASKALVSPLTTVIGWWPLWDASGNALGFGPAQLDLTVSSTPLYRQDAAFPFGPQVGIDFDGVDDYFESTNAAFDDTGPITMGAWVIPGVASTAMSIMGQASAGAGYLLKRTAGNVFEAAIGNTTGPTFRTATGTRTVVAGQPYRVVMTATGGTVTLYVNGEVEAVTGGGALAQSIATNGFRVGGSHNLSTGTAEYWDGIIADAFFTSDAWTATQVKTDYKQGVAAVHGTPAPIQGMGLNLDPRAGATNVLQLVGAGASAPTLRLGTYWRSRYA